MSDVVEEIIPENTPLVNEFLVKVRAQTMQAKEDRLKKQDKYYKECKAMMLTYIHLASLQGKNSHIQHDLYSYCHKQDDDLRIYDLHRRFCEDVDFKGFNIVGYHGNAIEITW